MHKWMNQGTTYCYKDLFADIKMCSKYGFEAIEMKYNQIKNMDLNSLREHLYCNNVLAAGIGAFELPIVVSKKTKKTYDKKFVDMCRIGKKLQTEYILINICGKSDFESICDLKEYIKQQLTIYSNIAKQYGLSIAIEATGYNGNILLRMKDCIQILSEIKCDNVGIVFDIYHFVGMNEEIEVLNSISSDMISVVHVCDGIRGTSGFYTGEDRKWPGEGNFDLRKFIEWLNKIDYTGPVSVEVFSEKEWKIDMEECYQTANKKYLELIG